MTSAVYGATADNVILTAAGHTFSIICEVDVAHRPARQSFSDRQQISGVVYCNEWRVLSVGVTSAGETRRTAWRTAVVRRASLSHSSSLQPATPAYHHKVGDNRTLRLRDSSPTGFHVVHVLIQLCMYDDEDGIAYFTVL